MPRVNLNTHELQQLVHLLQFADAPLAPMAIDSADAKTLLSRLQHALAKERPAELIGPRREFNPDHDYFGITGGRGQVYDCRRPFWFECGGGASVPLDAPEWVPAGGHRLLEHGNQATVNAYVLRDDC
jgi:hypothetical protein